MNVRSFLCTALCTLTVSLLLPAAKGESLPADHATAGIVKQYLEAIVRQDWATASNMLLPASLERRKQQMVLAVKNSRTMDEESEKLTLLGVKTVSDLEKLPATDAYVADRKAVHDRLNVSPETIKRKQETLKINILGLVTEDEGKIVHAVVRTSQETTETSISELLLISLAQDKADATKWFIVPDMQQPITTALPGVTPAAAPAAGQ